MVMKTIINMWLSASVNNNNDGDDNDNKREKNSSGQCHWPILI